MLHKIKSSIGVISIPDVMRQIKVLESKIQDNFDSLKLRGQVIKLIKKIELVLSLLEKEVNILKANSN